MANATANVQLNVTGNASQQLQKLQKSVGSLQSSFGALKNAIGGIAIGTFFTNLLRTADATDELAKATGLSIAAIEGLNNAFITNGGDADAAQNAIIKFSNSLSDAANGSDKLIQSFSKIGVSLNDIATLSEEDVFRKTIEGLGKLPPGAQRTAIAMELLGKQVRTVDFTGVNNELDNFIDKSKEAAPGIESAAALFGNLQAVGKQFGTELTTEFSGAIGILKDLTSNTKEIAQALVTLTKIVAAFGAAWLIFAKILPLINNLTGFVRTLKFGSQFIVDFTTNLKGLVIQFVAMFRKIIPALNSLKIFGTLIGNTRGGIVALINVFANLFRIFFRFAGIAGIIYGIIQAIDLFVAKVLKLPSPLEWVGEKLSWLGQKFKEFLQLTGFEFDTKPLETTADAIDAVGNAANKTGQNIDEIYEKNKKFLESVKDISKAYREQNDEVLKTLNNQIKSLHMTDQQIAIAKLEEDSIKSLQKTLDDLEQKRKEAIEQRNKGGIDNVDAIDREIISVRKLAEATLQSSKVITNAYHTELNMIEMRKQALDESIASAQNQLTIQQLEDQITLIGLYGDELASQTQYLQVIHDLQNTIQGYVEELLRLEQLRKENRIGEAEYQREVNHIQNMITLSAEYANARIEAEQKILEAQQAVQENARLGVEEAIANISKQFEPYQMAQDAILMTWNKIGSAVDTFVQTGKFKFSDFAKSVLRDLAAMIIKAQILFAIKKTLGFFGLSIPGLAEGGPAVAGKPYIVGEKGPELFVPKQSGTVVPNDKIGATGTATGMVNAPVTNNYITNNINALDAKSVAQLFAENRKTLLGVTETARRELAYGS